MKNINRNDILDINLEDDISNKYSKQMNNVKIFSHNKYIKRLQNSPAIINYQKNIIELNKQDGGNEDDTYDDIDDNIDEKDDIDDNIDDKDDIDDNNKNNLNNISKLINNYGQKMINQYINLVGGKLYELINTNTLSKSSLQLLGGKLDIYKDKLVIRDASL